CVEGQWQESAPGDAPCGAARLSRARIDRSYVVGDGELDGLVRETASHAGDGIGIQGFRDYGEMTTHLLLVIQLLAAASGPAALPGRARSVPAHNVTIVYSGVRGELKVAVPRLLQDARIDGALDEPAWQQAAVL